MAFKKAGGLGFKYGADGQFAHRSINIIICNINILLLFKKASRCPIMVNGK